MPYSFQAILSVRKRFLPPISALRIDPVVCSHYFTSNVCVREHFIVEAESASVFRRQECQRGAEVEGAGETEKRHKTNISVFCFPFLFRRFCSFSLCSAHRFFFSTDAFAGFFARRQREHFRLRWGWGWSDGGREGSVSYLLRPLLFSVNANEVK